MSAASPAGVVSGRLPSSFVRVTRSSTNAPSRSVSTTSTLGSGTISASNLPGRLRGGRALLALERVGVLRVARDPVVLRDRVGGLQHRHVDVGLVTQHPLLGEAVHVHDVLHHRDRLAAAGDDDLRTVGRDAPGGDRDRLQSRRTVAVDRHARDASPANRRATRRRGRGCCRSRLPVSPTPRIDVLDLGRIDAGPRHGMRDRVARERRAVRLVERAAKRASDRRARRRNDRGFTHAADSVCAYHIGPPRKAGKP